jgi:nitric oxide reductase NorQ protein
MQAGMPVLQACRATLVEPLSDDADVREGLMETIRATFGG